MTNLLSNKQDIIAWLDKYNIEKYTLLEDAKYGFVVEVAGDVDLSEKGLGFIAVKFGAVDGYFSCSLNQLTSLEGAPNIVGHNFSCGFNQLTSLAYAPTKVGGTFQCCYNKLVTLEGCPIEVGYHFDCDNNELTSLKGCPEFVKEVFSCRNNNLENLHHMPKSVGREFSCDGNPMLGHYQSTDNFSKMQQMLLADKEKLLLSSIIEADHTNIYKI